MAKHSPVVVTTLALSAGCSSFGVTTTETPALAPFSTTVGGAAKVCVVRGGELPAPFFTTVVYDNAKLVGATKDGTYFCYLKRFSMAWNGRGCLSAARRVNGAAHDRGVFAGLA